MTDKEKDFDATDFAYKYVKATIEGEVRPPHPDKTDLEAIKKVMRSMLERGIETHPYNMNVIYHPFLADELFLLRTPDEETYKEVHILEDSEGFIEVKKRIQKRIDETNSVDGLFLLVTRPFLLSFLEAVEPFLSYNDLSRILKDVWMKVDYTDYQFLDERIYDDEIIGIFNSCNPEVLMGEDDYRYYQELPKELIVYRGMIEDDEEGVDNMSWTLDLDVAIQFATRYRNTYGKSKVYKARIYRHGILAYFSDRNESTVIVVPSCLLDAEEIEEIQ